VVVDAQPPPSHQPPDRRAARIAPSASLALALSGGENWQAATAADPAERLRQPSEPASIAPDGGALRRRAAPAVICLPVGDASGYDGDAVPEVLARASGTGDGRRGAVRRAGRSCVGRGLYTEQQRSSPGAGGGILFLALRSECGGIVGGVLDVLLWFALDKPFDRRYVLRCHGIPLWGAGHDRSGLGRSSGSMSSALAEGCFVGERAGSHEEGLFSREFVGDIRVGDCCAALWARW